MVESVSLSRAEQADEALLMGLRLNEGLDLDRLLAVSGMRPGARATSELLGLGLIERCGERRLRATRSGQIVLNEVVLRLASALEQAPPSVPASVEVEGGPR
jgi:oxygen-independent coproporphyrinogen-3 oxidase